MTMNMRNFIFCCVWLLGSFGDAAQPSLASVLVAASSDYDNSNNNNSKNNNNKNNKYDRRQQQGHYQEAFLDELSLAALLWEKDVNVTKFDHERQHYHGKHTLVNDRFLHVRRRRLQGVTTTTTIITHEYNASCANPALLYNNNNNDKDNDNTATTQLMNHECKCEPDRFDGYHRIVCWLPDMLDCTTFDACVGQYDVWVFQETTGQFVTRSTCLPCMDDDGDDDDPSDANNSCQSWRNVCITAHFDADTNDMDTCSVTMTESSPPVVCHDCTPCIIISTNDDDDQASSSSSSSWGMQFSCFDISTRACTNGIRMASHPFDLDGPSPGAIKQAAPNKDSSSSLNKNQATATATTVDNNHDTLVTVVAIAGAVNALLMCAVLVVLVSCLRRRQDVVHLETKEGVFKVDNNNNQTTADAVLDLTLQEDGSTATPPNETVRTMPGVQMRDDEHQID